jgi:16S rRNA G1207 methylase RsmC
MKKEININKLREDIVINETLCGESLTFHTTWGLFSPREIDEGTRLMLKYIEVDQDSDILDLGCGYGPIGITLARLAPSGQTLMVDKDFVAVEYCQNNIKINGLPNAQAILSNGLEHIGDREFDRVVSNIPAKVGKELLWLMLNDAKNHMRSQGSIYVVTINGLRQFMAKNLKQIFGNYKKLKQGAHYTVAMAIKE